MALSTLQNRTLQRIMNNGVHIKGLHILVYYLKQVKSIVLNRAKDLKERSENKLSRSKDEIHVTNQKQKYVEAIV